MKVGNAKGFGKVEIVEVISEHKKPNRKFPVPKGHKRVMAIVKSGGHRFTAHVDVAI